MPGEPRLCSTLRPVPRPGLPGLDSGAFLCGDLPRSSGLGVLLEEPVDIPGLRISFSGKCLVFELPEGDGWGEALSP